MQRAAWLLFCCVVAVTLAALAQTAPRVPAQGATTSDQQHPPARPPADATAAQLTEIADALCLRKEYDRALAYYAAAVRKDAKNAVLYNKRGIAELQLNDLPAAQRDFRRAIKKNGRYAEAQNNLGVIFYLQRNYRGAIRQYQKALQLRETSASVHSNLGTAWFALREFDKATGEYARALELDPEVLMESSATGLQARILSPEERAHYSYVLARIYAKRGDVEHCLQCLRKAKEDGYERIQDAYKDEEFLIIRSDRRFAELMGRTVPE